VTTLFVELEEKSGQKASVIYLNTTTVFIIFPYFFIPAFCAGEFLSELREKKLLTDVI